MPEIILSFRVLIVIGSLVAIAETLASALWLPVYFRHGIQLYARNVVGNLSHTRRDVMDLVSCSQTGFSFHRLSPDDIAFREPLITFTRMPVMHGRLVYDGSALQVRGLINWTVMGVGVLFFALGCMFVPHAPIYAILLLAAVIGSLVWSFDSQRKRFNDLVIELTAQLKPAA
jgi:hypothetical protein